MKRYRGWITPLALSASMTGACGGEDGGSTDGDTTQGDTTDCKAYLNETSLGAVTFNVKNNRATAVYVARETCSSTFSVTAPGLATSRADLSGLSLTCEQAQKSADIAPDCLDNSAAPIEPGATRTYTWGGLLYEDVEMPASCFGPATSFTPTSCLQGKAPAAGMVEVAILLYAQASCDMMGQCVQPEAEFEVKKSALYPDEGNVDIDVN